MLSWIWITLFAALVQNIRSALQNASYVRAVGQIELVFACIASWLVFKEKSTTREFVGIGLIVLSILLILLYQ